MSTAHQSKPSGLLSPQYINFVYLPSAVLLLSAGAIDLRFLPVAAVISALLGTWQFYFNGEKIEHPVELVKDSLPEKNDVLDPKVFQEFPLKEKTEISHNVAIYRFGLPKSTNILGLPIGQHISVAAKIEGQPKDVARSYTPISSDEDKGFFDLLIKSYPTGNISKYMAQMTIGQNLKVMGPKGAMVYTPGLVRRFGMIAGGTGITPMLQIIRAIIRGRPRNGGKDTTQVDLIFANVNKEDILLKDDLDNLVAEDDGFKVHYVLNNPPEKWDGGVGFCTPEMIKERLPAPAEDIKILICGPPPMVKAMRKATDSLGYQEAKAYGKLADQVFCF